MQQSTSCPSVQAGTIQIVGQIFFKQYQINSNMILLLGGNGYVGHSFQRLFKQNGVEFRVISRADHNYADRDTLIALIRETQPEFLINSAGYTGKPNVDACEIYKADCLLGNAVLPGIIREACEATKFCLLYTSPSPRDS